MNDDRRLNENESDGGSPPRSRDEYGVFAVGPNETVTEAVVHAVASTSGTDPLELEPLYEVLDPDALDSLVRSESVDPTTTEGGVTVTFSYAGYRIAVDETGLLHLRGGR